MNYNHILGIAVISSVLSACSLDTEDSASAKVPVVTSVNDADSDGVNDNADNCPNTSNSDQTDANNNGIGVACEAVPTVTDITATTDEVTPITIDLAGVDGSDSETDVLTYTVDGVELAAGESTFTYTPTSDDDAEKVFTYFVSDGENTSEAATITLTIIPYNDPTTGTVTIEGQIIVGQTLTATNTLADLDGDIVIVSYQWLADGEEISGATSDTYLLTENEIGKAISVVVVHNDGTFEDITTESAATGAILDGSTPLLVEQTSFEAECAALGSMWKIVDASSASQMASGDKYVLVPNGDGNNTDSDINTKPAETYFTVNPVVLSDGDYNVYVRYAETNVDQTDDSFFLSVNGSSLTKVETGGTSDWTWLDAGSYTLSNGSNQVIIALREDGLKIDKVYVGTEMPTGTGELATNCEVASYTFEDGIPGSWMAKGAGTALSTVQDANTGVYALNVSGRTAVSDGAQIDMLNTLTVGQMYDFSAQVKLAESKSGVSVNIGADFALSAGTQSVSLVDNTAVDSTSWTEVQGSATLEVSGSTEAPTALNLYLASDDATASFNVDDIVVSKVADAVLAEDETGTLSEVDNGGSGGPVVDNLWVEAECGTLSSNTLWDVIDASGDSDVASNNKYIVVPNGDGHVAFDDPYAETDPNVRAPETVVTLTTTVATAGTYTVYIRHAMTNLDGKDDSIFVSVNGGTFERNGNYYWGATDTLWAWDDGLSFDFVEGTNTIQLGMREDGFKIDKVFIGTTKPTDIGGSDLNCQ